MRMNKYLSILLSVFLMVGLTNITFAEEPVSQVVADAVAAAQADSTNAAQIAADAAAANPDQAVAIALAVAKAFPGQRAKIAKAVARVSPGQEEQIVEAIGNEAMASDPVNGEAEAIQIWYAVFWPEGSSVDSIPGSDAS